jgi:Xaa-Pro aminopeptidase
LPSDPIFFRARSVKSEFELEIIKTGIRIFDESFVIARENLRKNKDPERAMRIMYSEVALRGALPVIIPTQQHGYHWLGTNSPDYLELRKKWYLPKTYDRKNEIIRGDFCITYEGYWIDRAIYQWVNPEKSMSRVKELMVLQKRLDRMQSLLGNAVKVGMSGAEAEKAVRELQNEGNLHFHYWVHSLGLNLHEEPVIGTIEYARNDVYWEIGAVAAHELFAEGILYEDMYLLTEQGWKPLSKQYPFVFEE